MLKWLSSWLQEYDALKGGCWKSESFKISVVGLPQNQGLNSYISPGESGFNYRNPVQSIMRNL
jgi:hypothetical protein